MAQLTGVTSTRFEEKLKARVLRRWPAVFLVVIVGLAVAIRYVALPFQGWDYKDYFQHWFATLASSPGLTAFGQTSFSDYTPPYLYLMKLGAMLFPGQPLLVVKGISFVFEAVLGLTVYLLVRRKDPQSSWPPLAALAIVLFGPTVLFDGSVWGQSEAIYTSLLLLCLYCVISERNVLAFVAFALAFSFKAQAVFFLPLLVVLYFRRRISIALFAILPVTYGLVMLPAIMGGMHWSTALAVYFKQANFYKKLAMNAPTPYAWIPNEHYDIFLWFGLAWAAAAAVAVVSVALASRHPFTTLDWLRLSLALMLFVPYLTPGMHDRYFYPADILSVVYAFYVPRRFYLPVVITTISLLSYFPYLFDVEVVPVRLLSVAMLLPIGVVMYDYVAALVPGAFAPQLVKLAPSTNGHTSIQQTTT